MAQLGLFEGSHLPRTAVREALARGELHEARVQLERRLSSKEEAADAVRLERIASALGTAGESAPETVHGAFAAVLVEAEPRGFLSHREWFGLYARWVANELDADPGRRLRGWLGAHFEFAAGRTDQARRDARRIIESLPPGPAWIEAARIAFAHGEDATAREWIHGACLDSPIELGPDAPALEPCGVPALDAAPLLPPLPLPVVDLFDATRDLEGLPGLWTRWVAVVGEIDRVLAPSPSSQQDPPDADAPRAFLAALRAARRSRERDRARKPERCSDRELRARRRMSRLAPALLTRYLQGLGGVLF